MVGLQPSCFDFMLLVGSDDEGRHVKWKLRFVCLNFTKYTLSLSSLDSQSNVPAPIFTLRTSAYNLIHSG